VARWPVLYPVEPLVEAILRTLAGLGLDADTVLRSYWAPPGVAAARANLSPAVMQRAAVRFITLFKLYEFGRRFLEAGQALLMYQGVRAAGGVTVAPGDWVADDPSYEKALLASVREMEQLRAAAYFQQHGLWPALLAEELPVVAPRPGDLGTPGSGTIAASPLEGEASSNGMAEAGGKGIPREVGRAGSEWAPLPHLQELEDHLAAGQVHGRADSFSSDEEGDERAFHPGVAVLPSPIGFSHMFASTPVRPGSMSITSPLSLSLSTDDGEVFMTPSATPRVGTPTQLSPVMSATDLPPSPIKGVVAQRLFSTHAGVWQLRYGYPRALVAVTVLGGGGTVML